MRMNVKGVLGRSHSETIIRTGKLVVLLSHLYGEGDEPEVKIIDVFICKLRKKLAEATGCTQHIETVWGRGYLIRHDESERL